ncbi:MAG: right-handed parallel beta-helix repeat-containing protein [Oceanipulchritudo sp.]
MKLPLLLAAFSVPALCLQGAWNNGSLGLMEDSAAPFHYSLEHGWLYAPAGLGETEGFWWYACAYGLGWQHRQRQAGGWDYAPLIAEWIYPGGAEAPGWWWMNGQWRVTPARSVYYVAENGSDAASGTIDDPFATIGMALSVANANDTIRVREGTYREQLIPRSSGEPYFPITLEAHRPAGGPPEHVVVSAYQPLTAGQDGVGQWIDEGGNIFGIQLTAAFGTVAHRLLVRLDGKTGIDARWPNVDDNFDFFRGDRAVTTMPLIVSEDGANKVARYFNAGLDGYPSGAWDGALMLYLPGKGWTDGSTTVTASGPGYVEFGYNETTFGGNWNAASEGDIFMLLGRKVAIDQPGEFLHDVPGRDGPNGVLYVKFPDGKTPADTTVEVKRYSHGIRVSGSSHWRVRNIHFDGGVVETVSTTEDVHFDSISVEGVYLLASGSTDGAVTLDGVDVSLRDSFVHRSSISGVTVYGPGAVVENNVVGWTLGPGISTRSPGRDLIIQNNTVFMNGGQNISITAAGSRYLSNRAYLAGMIVTDIAAMNAWGSGDMDGMEVAWNMVHDNVAVEDRNRPKTWNGGMGIRFDSGGGAGVSNGSVHHNLVWNTTWDGINMWGLQPTQVNFGNAGIDIFNNTVGGNLAIAGSEVNVGGVSVIANYSDDYLSRYTSAPSGGQLTFDNNFTLGETIYGTEFGDPRFFNAAAFDYRPLPGSPLLGDAPQGAVSADGTFPVAGAIWKSPDPSLLSSQFLETVSGWSAIGVSGMPQALHLPDGTLLRVDGSILSDNLLHRYDIATHLAEAVFLIPYLVTPEPVSVEISFDGGNSFATLDAVTIDAGLNLETLSVAGNLDWSGRVNSAVGTPGGPLSNLRRTDAGNSSLQVGDNALNAELALVLIFDMTEVADSADRIHSWTLNIDATGQGLSPNPFPGAIDILVGPAAAPVADNADLYARINSVDMQVVDTLPAGFDIRGSFAIDLLEAFEHLQLTPEANTVTVLLRAADPAAPHFTNGIVEQTFFNVVDARMNLELVIP